MVVGESRLELLHWLNETLQLNYAKVEQCGTGAAFCQLMDLLYGSVPLSKVNFNPSISEYEALSNLKILQASFNRNGINKQIQVERLVKCRLQDNLELLQWFRRHWLEHQSPEMNYDAVARRKGVGSTNSSRRTTFGGPTNTTQNRLSHGNTRAVSGTSTSGSTPMPKRRVASSLLPSATQRINSSRLDTQKVGELEQQLLEKSQEVEKLSKDVDVCREIAESLQTERNFYFNKLRELEILTKNIQLQYGRDDAVAQQVKDMSVLDVVGQVQEILYMTEKGFEVQDNDAASF